MNSTAEKTAQDNADFQARGGLALADAFRIHAAIHSTAPSVTLLSGITLPVFVSNNGCRRVDVIVDSARPRGRCKFMEQNKTKSSHAAQRANAGARITHILPLDRQGRHTPPQFSGDWGMLEGDVLAKTCAAVLNAADVARHRAAPAPPAPPLPPTVPSQLAQLP
eukprot:4094696-Prymnesium_polylepis.1